MPLHERFTRGAVIDNPKVHRGPWSSVNGIHTRPSSRHSAPWPNTWWGYQIGFYFPLSWVNRLWPIFTVRRYFAARGFQYSKPNEYNTPGSVLSWLPHWICSIHSLRSRYLAWPCLLLRWSLQWSSSSLWSRVLKQVLAVLPSSGHGDMLLYRKWTLSCWRSRARRWIWSVVCHSSMPLSSPMITTIVGRTLPSWRSRASFLGRISLRYWETRIGFSKSGIDNMTEMNWWDEKELRIETSAPDALEELSSTEDSAKALATHPCTYQLPAMSTH